MRRVAISVLAVLGCGVGDSVATPDDPEVDCEAIFDRPGHGETFYEDNPTYVDDREIAWRLASPDVLGIDAAALESAAARLARSPSLLSLLVVRDGALAFERYYHGSAAEHSNNVHSASKTILGALAGIAVDDGLIDLDTPLAEVLPEHAPDPRISLGHVLTMSSGLAWTEDETEYTVETGDDWVGAILGQPMAAAPGAFNYSTGMSHVMSAVLERVTGQSTCAFAHERLLGPLGITAEHWGRDPRGVYSGGYNLYITPRELARFGLLLARGGSAGGRQLVGADWVESALRSQLDAGDGYGYGYYTWTRAIGGRHVAIAWGHGGQLIYLVPELDLMVVMTADTAADHPELDGEPFVAALIDAI